MTLSATSVQFCFFAKDERNQQLRVHHEHYLSQSDVHRIIEILE